LGGHLIGLRESKRRNIRGGDEAAAPGRAGKGATPTDRIGAGALAYIILVKRARADIVDAAVLSIALGAYLGRFTEAFAARHWCETAKLSILRLLARAHAM